MLHTTTHYIIIDVKISTTPTHSLRAKLGLKPLSSFVPPQTGGKRWRREKSSGGAIATTFGNATLADEGTFIGCPVVGGGPYGNAKTSRSG